MHEINNKIHVFLNFVKITKGYFCPIFQPGILAEMHNLKKKTRNNVSIVNKIS